MAAQMLSVELPGPTAAFSFEQIIIAGGDEDVTSRELLDWISPLLAGIPDGRWVSCQIDFGPGEQVLARYRHGGSEQVWNLTLDGRTDETRQMVERLPGAESLTMILLNDFTSQAVTLLDGIAGWLSIHDFGAKELAPVVKLLTLFEAMAGTG